MGTTINLDKKKILLVAFAMLGVAIAAQGQDKGNNAKVFFQREDLRGIY